MKVSNQRIINIINGIGNILNMSMPVKASYAIKKNISKLEKELEAYNSERQGLLAKYAKKDEEGKIVVEGNNIVIKEEYIADWNRDITELLNIELEIDVHKFNIDYLNNCEISVVELGIIDFMFEEQSPLK